MNIAKTADMVLNRTGRLLKESNSFYNEETRISPTREYKYLGIVFTLSGCFKIVKANLRQRALRGHFSLNDKLETHQENYRFQVVRRTDCAGGIVQLPGMAPV